MKMLKEHREFNITPAGLVLYIKRACFGALPDSFVSCTCCGAGVLEVKCLFVQEKKEFTVL